MRKKLIFDFVGTSGSGKSTIMNDLLPIIKANGYTTSIIESSSRTLREKFNFGLYDELTDFPQSFISLTNWANILKSVLHNDVTLCTDLGVRSLVYAQYSPNKRETIEAHRWILEFFKSELFQVLIKPVHIYIPLEIDIDINPIDAHRGFISVKKHKEICELTDYTLETLKIPHFVLSGTPAERLEKMENLFYNYEVFLKEPDLSRKIL